MEDLSLHILDIVENSIAAQASSVSITIEEDSRNDTLTIAISDTGKGLDEEIIDSVTDPYYTTRKTRNIGMGLPLLKDAAENCNGSFSIQSEKDAGTTIMARFQLSNIDRQPLGDIGETLATLFIGYPQVSFHFVYRRDNDYCTIDSTDVIDTRNGTIVSTAENIKETRETIKYELRKIGVIRERTLHSQ